VFLKDHAELWTAPRYHKLHETLIEAGSDIAHVEQFSNAELTRAIVSHYEGALAGLSVPLTELRQSRDKVIAHNEAIERSVLQIPTWEGAISLVNHAKDFVSTIGLGYLNTHFGQGCSDYHLTNHAQRTSRSLRRLLEAANISTQPEALRSQRTRVRFIGQPCTAHTGDKHGPFNKPRLRTRPLFFFVALGRWPGRSSRPRGRLPAHPRAPLRRPLSLFSESFVV
jgi:hypothetical protein